MELEDEREKKRKAEEDANAAADSAELKKKKEEYEAEKKTWDDEKAELKTKIKAVEESINWAKKESKAAITRGLRTDDNKVKDTCFKQVGECETRIAVCRNSYRPSRGSLLSCARKSRRERSKGNNSGFKNYYSPTRRQGFW